MADPFNPEDVEKYKPLFKREQSPRVFGTPKGLASLEAERSGLASFLGVPDYDAQLEKSREDAKLQFYLQMAQRGFAAAGAAPRRGESTVSTLSRELFSPLAGDASKLAGQFTKEKRAIDTAKKAGDRQIRLAALQNVQSRQDKAYEYDAEATAKARNLVMQLAKTDDEVSTNYTVAGENVPVIVRKGYDGGIKGFFEIDGKTPIKRDAVKVFNASKAKPITSWITDVKVKGPEGAWIDAPGTLRIADSTGQNSRVVHKGLTLNFNESSKGYNAKIVNPGSKDSLYVSPVIEKALPTQKLANLLGLKNLDLTKTITRNTHRPKGDSGAQAYSTFTIGGATYDLRKMGDSINGKLVRTYNPVAQTIIKDGTTYNLAELTTYADPKDTAKDKETDAQRATAANVKLLYSTFGPAQARTRGPGMPLTDRSALIYRPELANKNKFPFMAVDPTAPKDRSKDMVLPERFQTIIREKIKSAANLIKGETGTTGALAREGRAVTAANSVLRLTGALLYGAEDVPEVKYTKEAFLRNRAEQKENVKNVVKELRENPASNPADIYASVVYPTNAQQINQTPYRVKIAAKHFPGAMDTLRAGDPNLGIRGGYNPDNVTDRINIEAVLDKVLLRPNDSPEQHRAVIQNAAAKLAEKQEALQSKTTSRHYQEEVSLRLALRQALINFKNASRNTNIEGFATGTFGRFMSEAGWAEALAGDMAPHWTALTVASNRLSEGLSRRQGKEEFGDDRISNADAEAYKKLVADISKGKNINKLLIDQNLVRLEKEIGGIVKKFGGSTAFEKETLEEVTRMGVDLSETSTKNGWHGHGFYGGTRFKATGQFAPTLSKATREALKREGVLNDSKYLNRYQVPTDSKQDGSNPTFSDNTKIENYSEAELSEYIKNVKKGQDITIEEARKRVLNSITGYYKYLDTLRK